MDSKLYVLRSVTKFLKFFFSMVSCVQQIGQLVWILYVFLCASQAQVAPFWLIAIQTITLVSHFVLAIILHPEVLVKAQKEIDSVIEDDRLPNFNDRSSLPYIESLMSECFRWAAPVPLGRILVPYTYLFLLTARQAFPIGWWRTMYITICIFLKEPWWASTLGVLFV